jgi:hypothetical protein
MYDNSVEGRSDLPYVHVTIRVPEPLARQVRELAKFSGWQLADLQRTLICLGATFFILSCGTEASEEAATTLMGGMKLLRFSRSFRIAFRRRPYAFRHHTKSMFATLSLPGSVCEVIAAHAEFRHVARNQVYNKFLQQGLLIYLKAQANALSGAQDRKTNSSPVSPGSVAEEADGRTVVW